jgi:hypothetical protein
MGSSSPAAEPFGGGCLIAEVFPRITRRLPPEPTQEDRLRYVRHLGIRGALVALPFWAVIFVFTQGAGVTVLFAVVMALSVVSIAWLSWLISRAKGRQEPQR